MHNTANNLFKQELNGGIPVLDSLILGGTGMLYLIPHQTCANSLIGQYPCSDLDPLCCSGCHGSCTVDLRCAAAKVASPTNTTGGGPFTTVFKQGKRYLVRLINASSESMFIFSIDNHDLTVIATDLVPIKPYKTDSIFIGIGMMSSLPRYAIL